MSAGANGRIAVNSGTRGLDAFEAAVLALNLPASSAGVNYQFSQGSFICVPNLYSSSGARAAHPALCSIPITMDQVAARKDNLRQCACVLRRHSGALLVPICTQHCPVILQNM